MSEEANPHNFAIIVRAFLLAIPHALATAQTQSANGWPADIELSIGVRIALDETDVTHIENPLRQCMVAIREQLQGDASFYNVFLTVHDPATNKLCNYPLASSEKLRRAFGANAKLERILGNGSVHCVVPK